MKRPGQCVSAVADHVGARITLQNCAGLASQQWRYDPGTGLMINAQAGGLCMEVPEGMIYDHTLLQLASCDPNNAAQQFSYSAKQLKSRIDLGQVLDVSGGDSSTLIMYASHGKANQRWHATLY